MPQPRGIEWTPKQQEIRALIEQGKSHKELVNAGYSKSLLAAVNKALRAEGKPKPRKPPQTALVPAGSPGGQSSPRVETFRKSDPPLPQTTIKGRIAEVAQVGSILIVPRDWYFTQYQALIILDTFERVKQDIGFTWEPPDLLTECVKWFRRDMRYDINELVGPTLPQLVETIKGEVEDNDNGEAGGGVSEPGVGGGQEEVGRSQGGGEEEGH